MPVTQCATAAFDDHDLMPLLCRRIAISLKLHETSGGFRGKRGASHDAAFFASLFVNFSAHGRLLRENEDFTRKYTEKIRTFKVLDKKSRTTTLSKDTMASWPRHWSRYPRNISGALTLHGSPWKCSSERALRAPPFLSGCFSKIFKASQGVKAFEVLKMQVWNVFNSFSLLFSLCFSLPQIFFNFFKWQMSNLKFFQVASLLFDDSCCVLHGTRSSATAPETAAALNDAATQPPGNACHNPFGPAEWCRI